MDGNTRDPAGRSISRRQFLQRSSGIAAGLLLASCGAPAAEPERGAATSAPAAAATSAPATVAPAGEQQIVLKVLQQSWGELYNGLMTKISDEFTKANPGITVDWTFTEEWETKLLTQVAGGTPPDANLTTTESTASLAEKGTYRPLDSYLQAEGLKREDFVTALYDAGSWEGNLYSIPGGADYITLWWSKDLYKDAGLDPEQPPKTANELIAHSTKILKKASNGDIERLGYSPNASDLRQWGFIFGGEWYDVANKQVTANHPANVEALQWLLEYVKMLDVNKLTAFNERPGYDQSGNPFATKQSAYLMQGFWAYDALDKYAPDIDYGVTLWPTLKGTPEEMKNYLIGGWMYAIPKNAKNPDAAWKFIKYAFIDEAAKMGYLTLNGPAIKNSFAAFGEGLKQQIGANNRLVPYIDMFTKTGEAGTKYWPVMPVNAFYYDELQRVYDFVIRGEKTPKEGLDEVTKNVQAELDKVKG